MADTAERGFLLTWNPKDGGWDEEDYRDAIEATSAGVLYEGRWSTGSRKGGMAVGDRVFLLRQGPEPRGIVASGWCASGVHEDEHWQRKGESANYVEVDFDQVIDADGPLPRDLLGSIPGGQHWDTQGSGIRIKDEVLAPLEDLWREHTGRPPGHRRAGNGPGSAGQGWQRNEKLRRQTENAAQDRLMQHYRDLGWDVEDTRFGNSFDAKATRGDELLYLEAKGTIGAGEFVIVTRGEVRWAREHPRQCVIGILSDLATDANGDVDPASGIFHIFDWQPEDGNLEARDFDWTPDKSKLLF